jgi:hypothetical protein
MVEKFTINLLVDTEGRPVYKGEMYTLRIRCRDQDSGFVDVWGWPHLKTEDDTYNLPCGEWHFGTIPAGDNRTEVIVTLPEDERFREASVAIPLATRL